MHIFPCFFYRNFILLYIFFSPKASPSLRILSKPCESKLLLKCEVIHFFLLSHTQHCILYVLRGAGTLEIISRFYCKLDSYKVLLMGKPRRKLDGKGGEVCQFPFLCSLELSTQQQWTDTGHCLMGSSRAYTVPPFFLGLSARKPCLSSTVQPSNGIPALAPKPSLFSAVIFMILIKLPCLRFQPSLSHLFLTVIQLMWYSQEYS